MSLTKNEITPGRIYRIKVDPKRLNLKRFNHVRAALKDIEAKYDGASQTWTVALADDPDFDEFGSVVPGYGTLRDLADDTDVTAVDAADRLALEAERARLAARLAEIDRLLKQYA